MKYFKQLVHGTVGKVNDGVEVWDEDEDCVVLDDVKYDMGEEIGDIDDFLEDVGVDNLTLYKDQYKDQYRDEAGYCDGIVITESGDVYWLEITNEYMVYELNKR